MGDLNLPSSLPRCGSVNAVIRKTHRRRVCALQNILGASVQSCFCMSGWNTSKSCFSSRFKYVSAGTYPHPTSI
jgi:hypothetical protein